MIRLGRIWHHNLCQQLLFAFPGCLLLESGQESQLELRMDPCEFKIYDYAWSITFYQDYIISVIDVKRLGTHC